MIDEDELGQRLAWRNRLLEALLGRQFGDETLTDMIMSGFDQAYAEGLLDAAGICKGVAAGSPKAERVAGILERSIRDLVKMNKAGKDLALPIGLEPMYQP